MIARFALALCLTVVSIYARASVLDVFIPLPLDSTPLKHGDPEWGWGQPFDRASISIDWTAQHPAEAAALEVSWQPAGNGAVQLINFASRDELGEPVDQLVLGQISADTGADAVTTRVTIAARWNEAIRRGGNRYIGLRLRGDVSVHSVRVYTRIAGEPSAGLVVTDVEQATNPHAYDTELDNRYVTRPVSFTPETSAIVLIDTWASHVNDGWTARADANMKAYLGPALDAARAAGMVIIHAPTNQPIHPRVGSRPNEYVIDTLNGVSDTEEVYEILRRHGIKTVFYAGYATNACMIGKGASLVFLHWRDPNLMILLLSDATIAFEMPEDLAAERSRRAFTIYAMMVHTTQTAAASNEQFFRGLELLP